MGLLSRLLGRTTERRDASWSALAAALPVGSTRINAVLAENLSSVVACVNAIADGLAMLPAAVYRMAEHGRTEAPTHPVAALIRRPNARQSWPDFAGWLMG
ncbi:phage portal protein, partial [Stenotrophomonas sp. A3_2]|uniref:phage portal protein n=1 Tax=Stenotrophomonas sp. A3_2 TaxID=3119978 RepID=UPI002FC30695